MPVFLLLGVQQEQIKNLIEQECSLFHKADLKQKCLEIVDRNADFIIDEIIKNADPKEVCKGIALCKAKSLVKTELAVDRMMTKYTEQPQCILCQFIMTKVEAELKDKKTESELEGFLRGICKQLPAKYGAECNKFIEEYTQLIITLVDTIPPKEFCGQINLCRANKVDTSRSMYF